MDIVISSVNAFFSGLLISAAFYTLKTAFYYIHKIFTFIIDKSKKASASALNNEQKKKQHTAFNCIFLLLCALVYSTHLYITLNGVLRFIPLLCGVSSFAVSGKFVFSPAARFLTKSHSIKDISH